MLLPKISPFGASAPEGLQLDAAHAYNMLVGVPSVEEPNLLRVNPENPDESYMVLKIEGAPGIDDNVFTPICSKCHCNDENCACAFCFTK